MSDEMHGEVMEKLRNISEGVKDIKDRMGKVEGCINGNGKKGLKDRITTIETWGIAISSLFGVLLTLLGIYKR